MIAKVVPRARGGSPGGTRRAAVDLTGYLLGPGDLDRAIGPARAGDGPARCGSHHTRPTVVAGSASLRPGILAARCTAVDWTDPAAAWAALDHVARDAATLLTTPLDAATGPADRDLLWHTVLAAHPDDPVLPDPAWRAVAAHLMAGTGLDPDGDRATAVPWLAVRHGPNQAGADHVHVVALLLRPDGSPASRNDDVFAAQATARWAEESYTLTPGKGRTSPHQPRQGGDPGRPVPRGDLAASRRTGPPPQHPGWDDDVWAWAARAGVNRMWTAQGRAAVAVRSALARSWDTAQLLDLLAGAGYTARLRHDPDDPAVVTGWSVVGPGASGRPRAWRGRDLGADLSWPRIEAHLAALPRRGNQTGPRDHGWPLLTTITGQVPDDPLQPWQAYWLRDALFQLAAAAEPDRRGPWTDAADLYASCTVTRSPPKMPHRPPAVAAPPDVPGTVHSDLAALALAARSSDPDAQRAALAGLRGAVAPPVPTAHGYLLQDRRAAAGVVRRGRAAHR